MNNPYEGFKFARPIKSWLEEHGISLPSKPQLLGLGAGLANPECALADGLEIPYEDVTLVDKRRNIPNSKIFKDTPEDIAYVEQFGARHRANVNYLTGRGIFDYLANPDRTDFSYVTAIGIEYLLNDPEAMKDLIKGLPNVLLPNAFVCIYPHYGINPERAWIESGFVKVENLGSMHNYANSLLYVYANPHKNSLT